MKVWHGCSIFIFQLLRCSYIKKKGASTYRIKDCSHKEIVKTDNSQHPADSGMAVEEHPTTQATNEHTGRGSRLQDTCADAVPHSTRNSPITESSEHITDDSNNATRVADLPSGTEWNKLSICSPGIDLNIRQNAPHAQSIEYTEHNHTEESSGIINNASHAGIGKDSTTGVDNMDTYGVNNTISRSGSLPYTTENVSSLNIEALDTQHRMVHASDSTAYIGNPAQPIAIRVSVIKKLPVSNKSEGLATNIPLLNYNVPQPCGSTIKPREIPQDRCRNQPDNREKYRIQDLLGLADIVPIDNCGLICEWKAMLSRLQTNWQTIISLLNRATLHMISRCVRWKRVDMEYTVAPEDRSRTTLSQMKISRYIYNAHVSIAQTVNYNVNMREYELFIALDIKCLCREIIMYLERYNRMQARLAGINRKNPLSLLLLSINKIQVRDIDECMKTFGEVVNKLPTLSKTCYGEHRMIINCTVQAYKHGLFLYRVCKQLRELSDELIAKYNALDETMIRVYGDRFGGNKAKGVIRFPRRVTEAVYSIENVEKWAKIQVEQFLMLRYTLCNYAPALNCYLDHKSRVYKAVRYLEATRNQKLEPVDYGATLPSDMYLRRGEKRQHD